MSTKFGLTKEKLKRFVISIDTKVLPIRYLHQKQRLSIIANISPAVALKPYYMVVSFLEKYSTG